MPKELGDLSTEQLKALKQVLTESAPAKEPSADQKSTAEMSAANPTDAPTKPTVNESAMGDVSSAQDENTDKGHKVDVKSIGLEETPHEEPQNKVIDGKATKEEVVLFGKLSKEKYKDPHTLATSTAQVGNQVSDIPTKEMDGMEKTQPKDAEDKMYDYGFSKEDLEDKFKWSTLSKTEKNITANVLGVGRSTIKDRRLEQVRNAPSIAGRRESKTGVRESSPDDPYVVNGIDLQFPGIDKHIDNMQMTEQTGKIEHLYTRIPYLSPPKIVRGDDYIKARMGWVNTIESYREIKNEIMSEAIATTTSGAAMGQQANAPALIVPTNLSAMLRDTVYFQQLMQGYNTCLFQTITVPTAGALTQSTQPSDASQTLATVSIAPTPRGVEQAISFEAERKIMGPILEAVILSFRLSELYDEDFLLLGASQAFESAVVTGSGGVYGTANQLFGTARATEAAIISTDTMTVAFIDDAVAQLQAQYYATDNLVWVGHPFQYRKLLIDSNALRMVSFGPNTDNGRSMLAQGVIPEIIGAELRRSTLMATGTGSRVR